MLATAEQPVIALVSDAREFAGAEVYLTLVIERLRDRFDFVVLIGDRAPRELRDRLSLAGAKLIVVPGLRRVPTVGATVQLARELRKLRPAVVHLNLSDQGDGLASSIAARSAGRPTVATLHTVLPPPRPAWKEWISGATLRAADQVIAVSESIGNYLRARGLATTVVKNGLPPPEPHADARGTLGLDSAEFVVGGIGRLHRQKGWDILCRAAARVHESRPDIRFVVIGTGEEHASLAQEPTCRNVEFRGYVSNAASLLQAFDLLAMPSRYEGLGLVALEAMLAGTPVVASAIPGLDEALGDSARLVAPEEPDAFARAILELAGDEAQRANLVRRGIERARELFDPARMARETAAVYDSVLGKRLGNTDIGE